MGVRTSRRGSFRGQGRPQSLYVVVFVCCLIGVYYLGYSSGKTVTLTQQRSEVNPNINQQRLEHRTALNEIGLGVHQREVMGLSVIQNAQGFSEAYPVYQNEQAVTNATLKPIEKKQATQTTPKAEGEAETNEQDSYGEPTTLVSTGFSEAELLSDFSAYDSAPQVFIPMKAKRKKNLWWAVKAYEDYYTKAPIHNYIPRIRSDVQLTLEDFHTKFRRHGRPVIFTFDNLRNLGFKTTKYTLKELKALFPFDENVRTKVQSDFVANGIRKDDDELDLGPALVAIEKDEALAKQGKLRNFPRNLKVKQSAVTKLGIEKPPLIMNMEQFQLPTVWMGTSTSDTRFHHDCCDNFVMMITGTKRFTLAPPSDWRTLNPSCVGANKNLCWANVPYPNNIKTLKQRKIMDQINHVVVDIAPGEILYMPAGWFHHIENLGPTVMVNWWTKQGETVGLLNAIRNPSW